jgi:hypothetical protein
MGALAYKEPDDTGGDDPENRERFVHGHPVYLAVSD